MAAVATITLELNEQGAVTALDNVGASADRLGARLQSAGSQGNVVFTQMGTAAKSSADQLIDALGGIGGAYSSVGSAAKGVGSQSKDAFDGSKESILESRESAELFANVLGIPIPRALQNIIAHSETLGPLFQSAFSIAAVAGFTYAAVQALDTLTGLSDMAKQFGQNAQAAFDSSTKVAQIQGQPQSATQQQQSITALQQQLDNLKQKYGDLTGVQGMFEVGASKAFNAMMTLGIASNDTADAYRAQNQILQDLNNREVQHAETVKQEAVAQIDAYAAIGNAQAGSFGGLQRIYTQEEVALDALSAKVKAGAVSVADAEMQKQVILAQTAAQLKQYAQTQIDANKAIADAQASGMTGFQQIAAVEKAAIDAVNQSAMLGVIDSAQAATQITQIKTEAAARDLNLSRQLEDQTRQVTLQSAVDTSKGLLQVQAQYQKAAADAAAEFAKNSPSTAPNFVGPIAPNPAALSLYDAQMAAADQGRMKGTSEYELSLDQFTARMLEQIYGQSASNVAGVEKQLQKQLEAIQLEEQRNGVLTPQIRLDAEQQASLKIQQLYKSEAQEVQKDTNEAAIALLSPWQQAYAKIVAAAQEAQQKIDDTTTQRIQYDKNALQQIVGNDQAAKEQRIAIENDIQVASTQAAQISAANWTKAYAQMRDQLSNDLTTLFDDIGSGNLGKRIQQNFEKMFSQILAQWLITSGAINNSLVRLMGGAVGLSLPSGLGSISNLPGFGVPTTPPFLGGSLPFPSNPSALSTLGAGAGSQQLTAAAQALNVSSTQLDSSAQSVNASASQLSATGSVFQSSATELDTSAQAMLAAAEQLSAAITAFGSMIPGGSSGSLASSLFSSGGIGLGSSFGFGAGSGSIGAATPGILGSLPLPGNAAAASLLLGSDALNPLTSLGLSAGGAGAISAANAPASSQGLLGGLGALFSGSPAGGIGLASFGSELLGSSSPVARAAGGALTGFGVGSALSSLAYSSPAILSGVFGALGPLAGIASTVLPFLGPIGAGIGLIIGLIGSLFGPHTGDMAREQYYEPGIKAINQVVDSYNLFQTDYNTAITNLENIRTQTIQGFQKIGGRQVSGNTQGFNAAVDKAETTIKTTEAERERRAQLQFGPPEFAEGGFTGLGFEGGIPAVLHPGEYVLQRTAVDTVGLHTLDMINAGRASVRAFARGGMISPAEFFVDGDAYWASRGVSPRRFASGGAVMAPATAAPGENVASSGGTFHAEMHLHAQSVDENWLRNGGAEKIVREIRRARIQGRI